MKRLISFLPLALLVTTGLFGQVAKDQVVMINVQTTENAITLNWPAESGHTGTYEVYRKNDETGEWGDVLQSVPGSESEFTDTEIVPGEAYEYMVVKRSGNSNVALGYVFAAHQRYLFPSHKGIFLLLDSNVVDSISAELALYENTLEQEGYQVTKIWAGRNEKPPRIKRRITDFLDSYDGAPVGYLLIVGHVPVPYSGDFTGTALPPPDGHVEGSGNHTGAWPADVYYGDLDGNWYDANVNNTTGRQERHHNVPGDGKFDQSKIPSAVELAVGRIDFYDMPALSDLGDEYSLLRSYLRRNVQWRKDEIATVERALIDNNFGGFNLASTGYHNFSTFFPIDSVHDDKDFFTELRQRPYMWSYGCGAGSYTSCNGVGRTPDFVDTTHSIFTVLAGSFFGDWDIRDNFLRAPLAAHSLASFWGGLPKWYVHHMALGADIGYGTKLSQDNVDDYFNGSFNASQNSIHIALMGDPTLKMHNVVATNGLTASSDNGNINLTWNSANGNIDGYLVYRADSSGQYELLTPEPITDTSYIDEQNFYSGDYTYAVAATRLETTASGSYWNIGGHTAADVSHVNDRNNTEAFAHFDLYPNPASNILYVKMPLAEYKRLDMTVFNTSGQVMLQLQQNASQGGRDVSLDISTLAKGSYMLRVMSDNGIAHKRFVVQ